MGNFLGNFLKNFCANIFVAYFDLNFLHKYSYCLQFVILLKMTNDTWNKKLLNDQNCDSFEEAVLSAVTERLLHIIKEITPLILEKSKVIIEENASSLFKSYESKSNENLKKNVDHFTHENQDLWHSKLDRCKNVMFKYLRCDKQFLLYN